MEGFSLEDAPKFELWLETERTRWRGLFGELCGSVARLQAEAGRPEEALGTARLWTRHARARALLVRPNKSTASKVRFAPRHRDLTSLPSRSRRTYA